MPATLRPNRVLFAKSPWPQGHAIKTARLSAHLGAEGVFLDLDLQTENYNVDDDPDDAEDETFDDWQSKGVWANYGRCSLSSTKWGHRGVLVGTPKRPFSLSALDGATLAVDSRPPPPGLERAFGLYLLGHDGVAKHRLQFQRTRRGTWNVTWRAAIALEYIGHTRFEHSLRARLVGLSFEGIRVPKGLNDADDVLSRSVAKVESWRPTKRGGERWYRWLGTRRAR